MTEFLLRLGIMSIQASVIIGAVLLLRFLFSKLHIAKKYTNLLWIIPYIAMILPWGIKTPFSFWQFTQESQTKIEQAVNTMPYMADRFVQVTIDADVLKEMENNRYAPPSLENIQSGNEYLAENGINSEEEAENSTNPDTAGSVDNAKDYVTYSTDIGVSETGFFSNLTTWDVFIYCAFAIWLLGVIIFMTYGVVSSLKLKKTLVCSLLLSENIYVADDIREPFVFGVFSPKIYLPYNLTKDNEFYVVEHEKTHIQRKDPIKKVIAFVITGIHWFNPFAWMAFHMMTKDMEMACDEETVQRIGLENRQDYATALLKLSTKKKNLLIPVAFGEGNVKSRINNVLQYKKTIKILAALAAIVIVVVAAIFLTKPMEKTTVLSELPNYDVVRIPKADNPKAITVTYQGKVYDFDESYYDDFRIFLEELEVYEEELNKSRAEDRPADVVIQLEGSVAFNFDENMETFWCDNGVKPSMTYEIVEPKLAIGFLAAQIGAYESNSVTSDVDNMVESIEASEPDIQNAEEGKSFLDKQSGSVNSELDSEPDICGENGPFFDYADDRYVVFHTTERFYVYDITQKEMVLGIGFNDIYKVEMDAKTLKACIHEVDGDAISVYECDIVKGSCRLYGPLTIDAFDDFLVTSECVLHDPTVFRTKECIQITDGSYMYLESGSGLLADLDLINEDKNGNRTVYEIFDSKTYDGRNEKMTQVFTGAYSLEPMDITHDGEEEYIMIDVEKIQADRQKQAYLKVVDEEGNVLWQAELGLPRAGWNSYFRVETKEGPCLLQYLPVVMQERGEYSYRLFYLNGDGSEVTVASDSVDFSIYPNNVEVDGETAIPKEEMLKFADGANGYLEGARALISTVDGVLRYQTPAKTYSYTENYRTTLEAIDVDASESIELNITKLQNYYEKTRKDILKKDGVVLIEE